MPSTCSNSPPAPAGHVAARLLRQRLRAVLKRLRGATHDTTDQAERIHQLRVATRRARASLDFFAPLLPRRKAAWFRKQLRRLRQAADDARNVDVYRERLQRARVTTPANLDNLLRKTRNATQPILSKLDQRLHKKNRWHAKSVKLLRRVAKDKATTHAASQLWNSYAAEAIAPIVQSFVAATETSDASATALHTLRVAGKKLRYSLEIIDEQSPQRAITTLLRQLTKLQDDLGAINDQATASVMLKAYIKRADDAATARWLRTQLRTERNAFAQARETFLATWTAQRRKRLRQACAAVTAKTKTRGKRQSPGKKR